MGGDLVDHALGAEYVVRLVNQQRHPRAIALGQVHLALQLRVEHPQDEQHARLAVVGPDRGHVRVHDHDVARLDDLPQWNVGGMVEEPSQRGDAHQPRDLVARRVHPLGHAPRAHPQIVGQLGAEEFRRLVQIGLRRAGLGDDRPEVVPRRPQQRVDVLELRAALLLEGDRDRADHRVVQVAARGLIDLVLVDVEQRGDDVLGDLRRLDRQRTVADQPQRVHPERRVPQVEKPHPLAAVGRRPAQAQAR